MESKENENLFGSYSSNSNFGLPSHFWKTSYGIFNRSAKIFEPFDDRLFNRLNWNINNIPVIKPMTVNRIIYPKHDVTKNPEENILKRIAIRNYNSSLGNNLKKYFHPSIASNVSVGLIQNPIKSNLNVSMSSMKLHLNNTGDYVYNMLYVILYI